VFPLCSNFQEKVSDVKLIHTKGSTNLFSGYQRASELIDQSSKTDKVIERRIVMLTDMESFKDDALMDLMKKNSEKGIYTSIIGVSFELNTDLIESIIRIRGANYFSAIEDSHLDKIIVSNFEFNFFPVAFNVNLKLECGSLNVDNIYGSSFDKESQIEKRDWTRKEHYLVSKDSKKMIFSLLYIFGTLKKALPKPIVSTLVKMTNTFEINLLEINTINPSDLITLKNGDLLMEGGLIIAKCSSKSAINLEEVSNYKITIQYDTVDGKSAIIEDKIKLDLKKEGDDFKDAIGLFYWAYNMKNLLSIDKRK
jgi:hypothetical protein